MPSIVKTGVGDEPLMQHPVVRLLEVEAIQLYREKFPTGPLWQELADDTRIVWIRHAELARIKGMPNA